MQAKQVQQLLQQLAVLHPSAFKGNFLLYSQIKTKGLWDDRREFIPWLLALAIFIPLSLVLKDIILHYAANLSDFHAQAYAILAFMLLMMLVVPIVIKQIKHSSNSLYQLLKNSPIKLTVVIVLQALNLQFLQSAFVLWVLYLLAMSFGFIRFYKENLFRSHTQLSDYYQLQQLRRISFWSYKRCLILRLKIRFCSANQKKRQQYLNELNIFADLHTQMFKTEHLFCKKIKHTDLDSYLDEML